MATTKDKIAELKKRLKDPDALDNVLKALKQGEKAAVAAGLAFKEKGELDLSVELTPEAETLIENTVKSILGVDKVKADKKTDKVDEEGDEEAKPKEDEKMDEDEEEEETEEEDEDEKEFSEILEMKSVSELSPQQYIELLSGALTRVLDPYLTSVKAMSAEFAVLKEQVSTTKEADEKSAEQMKTVGEGIVALAKAIKSIKAKVDEMSGDVPPAAKGYKASEDDATVLDDDDEALKNAKPTDNDTIDAFANWAVNL